MRRAARAVSRMVLIMARFPMSNLSLVLLRGGGLVRIRVSRMLLIRLGLLMTRTWVGYRNLRSTRLSGSQWCLVCVLLTLRFRGVILCLVVSG